MVQLHQFGSHSTPEIELFYFLLTYLRFQIRTNNNGYGYGREAHKVYGSMEKLWLKFKKVPKTLLCS
jgi:hypothetical protein